MKILFALALLIAPAAQAQTYKGLTLGEVIPADMVPVGSQIWGDKVGAEQLAPHMLHLCEHEFLPMGSGRIEAITDGCDGPILRISAIEALSAFFNPDDQQPPVTTDIEGLMFKETTLSQARSLMRSEGLVAGRWFGRTDPDNIGAFALAYEIEGTPSVMALWFQEPRAWGLRDPNDAPVVDRDAAQLMAIDLISNEMFDLLNEGYPPPSFSNGYTALPNLFVD